MKHGYIYHTTVIRPTDGKDFHYIGQHLGSKIDKKYVGSGSKLNKMISKYGTECIDKVELVSWHSSQSSLNRKEVSAIRDARELYGKRCLNLMHGGANGTMHQATRDKLSIAHTGKVTSEATREKMRMSNIGKTRSKQTKARIAAARTGTKHTEETLKKMSETQKNRAPITEETRKKLSQANKGKKLSENHKSKIAKTLLGNTNGAGRLGTKHSEESKRRISESQIGRVQPKLKCPHCKKVGGQSAMKQWHFDNCKLA